jgi:hypothetical protein
MAQEKIVDVVAAVNESICLLFNEFEAAAGARS